MNAQNTKASIPPPETAAKEETCLREVARPAGEGLGVFRAFVLVLIFYFALGGILWYAWHAWRQWRAH